jgi:hypothetical protein
MHGSYLWRENAGGETKHGRREGITVEQLNTLSANTSRRRGYFGIACFLNYALKTGMEGV